jgi:hypothetical protein
VRMLRQLIRIGTGPPRLNLPGGDETA